MKTTICLNPKGGRGGCAGLQPSLHDRVYSVDGVACAIATAEYFNPLYLVEVPYVENQGEQRPRIL